MIILLVDDEPQIREVVGLYLSQAGHTVVESGDGRSAVETFLRVRPDFVVLDLMLPDLSGEDVCASLRRRSDVPILMLTAKVSEADKLRGFEVGADDYLTKPFSPRELLARITVISQRHRGKLGEPATLRSLDGRLRLDSAALGATLDGVSLDLTPTEYRLLAHLMGHLDRVFTREQLVTAVLGDHFQGFDRTIDVHVRNLRLKVEDDPAHPVRIVTVFGIGYKGQDL